MNNRDKKPIGTILLLTAKNGAGKDSVEEFFLEFLGKVHVSHMRELIGKISGSPLITRKDFTEYTHRMRKNHGAGYFVEEACKRIPVGTEFAIINSMRHPSEYDIALQYAEKVIIIAVLDVALDASSEEILQGATLRYNRLSVRGTSTDNFKSFKQFLNDDKEEWEPVNLEDPNAHWVKRCVEMAVLEGKGFFVLNNEDGLAGLQKVRETIEQYLLSRQILPIAKIS